MPLLGLPEPAVCIIDHHCKHTPDNYLKLASVNRDFRTHFLSDQQWQKFNVYQLDSGIAKDFLQRPGIRKLYDDLDELIGFGDPFDSPGPYSEIEPIAWQLWAKLPCDQRPLRFSYEKLVDLGSLLPLKLQRYKEFVIEVLTNRNIPIVVRQLCEDKDVVLAAVSHDLTLDAWAMRMASQRLQEDKDIVLAAVRRNPKALRHARKVNQEIALAAVQQHGMEIVFAKEFRNDKLVALKALQKDLDVFGILGANLKDDPDVVLAAIRRDPQLFSLASERLRDCFDFALQAVNIDGRLLAYVSERLQDSADIVGSAISEHECALRYASHRLRAMPELVHYAFYYGDEAIEYATGRLRPDEELFPGDFMRRSKMHWSFEWTGA